MTHDASRSRRPASCIKRDALGVGLVGLGRWGTNYARTLLALPECHLVAGVDTNGQARTRSEREFGIATLATLEELLAVPLVRAVVIATPDATHCSLATAALDSDKDILVEKPMALDPGEARSLAALARNRGRVLAVGHTAVYDLQFDSLRSGLRDLSVERLTAVRTSSGPSGSDGQPQVGNRQSRVIFDLCPHDIAMAVLLLGVPEAARAKNTATGVEYELRFDSETAMTGRAEWREPPHTRTFEVAYEHGTATVSGFSPSPLPARDTPLGRQCLDFITSCRERRRPRSDAKLGVDVARCLAAMNASCTDGHGWMPLRWGAE